MSAPSLTPERLAEIKREHAWQPWVQQLLDRLATLEDGSLTNEAQLQRAEAVVEAALLFRKLYDPVYKGWSFDMTKATNKLLKALAAWENGKL